MFSNGGAMHDWSELFLLLCYKHTKEVQDKFKKHIKLRLDPKISEFLNSAYGLKC